MRINDLIGTTSIAREFEEEMRRQREWHLLALHPLRADYSPLEEIKNSSSLYELALGGSAVTAFQRYRDEWLDRLDELMNPFAIAQQQLSDLVDGSGAMREAMSLGVVGRLAGADEDHRTALLKALNPLQSFELETQVLGGYAIKQAHEALALSAAQNADTDRAFRQVTGFAWQDAQSSLAEELSAIQGTSLAGLLKQNEDFLGYVQAQALQLAGSLSLQYPGFDELLKPASRALKRAVHRNTRRTLKSRKPNIQATRSILQSEVVIREIEAICAKIASTATQSKAEPEIKRFAVYIAMLADLMQILTFLGSLAGAVMWLRSSDQPVAHIADANGAAVSAEAPLLVTTVAAPLLSDPLPGSEVKCTLPQGSFLLLRDTANGFLEVEARLTPEISQLGYISANQTISVQRDLEQLLEAKFGKQLAEVRSTLEKKFDP